MRGGSGRRELLEPPFVGRDDELRLLKEQFDATARERKSRLITVIGEAGIGKSRLAWEFEKYLDGVVDNAYWHEGRSPSYGEGISYWALGEMVRRRAGIGEGDDEEAVRAALNATLELFVPDANERRWILPRLAGLLGIEELPAEGREELFAAWRTFFVRIAQQSTGGHGLHRPALGRPGDARLRREPPQLGPHRRRSSSSRSPVRSCSTAAPTGAAAFAA